MNESFRKSENTTLTLLSIDDCDICQVCQVRRQDFVSNIFQKTFRLRFPRLLGWRLWHGTSSQNISHSPAAVGLNTQSPSRV